MIEKIMISPCCNSEFIMINKSILECKKCSLEFYPPIKTPSLIVNEPYEKGLIAGGYERGFNEAIDIVLEECRKKTDDLLNVYKETNQDFFRDKAIEFMDFKYYLLEKLERIARDY